VPSNFTSRALQAIGRETAAPRPPVNRVTWFLRVLLPRAVVPSVILIVGVVTYHEHTAAERAELVQGVKVVTSVSSLPSPENLLDFDTIRQMPVSTGPDQELLSLMK
jgi:hypothetical protein